MSKALAAHVQQFQAGRADRTGKRRRRCALPAHSKTALCPAVFWTGVASVARHCFCARSDAPCIATTIVLLLACCSSIPPAHSADSAQRFGLMEFRFEAQSNPTNPYTDLTAAAELSPPGGKPTRSVPLFWDGGAVWKFRFAPDKPGVWTWRSKSSDPGLDGKSGRFEVTASAQPGSIQPMRSYPHHFERQDGRPFWFLGDTAWALYTDSKEEQHDRGAALEYLKTRAAQGFNVVHSMLLSEAGWGNSGGPPFFDLAAERLNPGYWREVDYRLAEANRLGLVCGLALAWGDKRGREPYAWRRFPSHEARKRYARYVAARYAAYNVYFLVSGEWHAEVNTRQGASEASIRREFVELGRALQSADPHGRMIGIHPMTRLGSVREFNDSGWMAFGDYQQNYDDLHRRILQSHSYQKPVVNSEYGYFLRDQSGDGVPDKDNSTSLEAMRHATWDIVMAGGYVITGFGTTYFGGNRDPGLFNVLSPKNEPWASQIGHLLKLFTPLEWWKLKPHDELLRCATPRGKDRRELNQAAPPRTTYWCLAEPGATYVIYMRGTKDVIELAIEAPAALWKARRFDPREGTFRDFPAERRQNRFLFQPAEEQDWLILLQPARHAGR